jgi:methionyl-tRNA formyltransferase
MKIVFMGTPALAVPVLEMLRAEHEIALVVTQPDKPAGRSAKPVASPVKQYALQHGLDVAQPERARDEAFIEQLRAVAPDAIAVVAFGQILPRAVLDLPPRGCINLHYSLLPRWRGAAPVQHALLAGDTTSGVTTQHMAEKLDAGDIILQRAVEIEPDETTGDLWQRLTPIGAEVLRDTMRLAQAGRTPRTPQPEDGITLAPSLKKSDGLIDWNAPAQDVVNRVRATNPWPGACCDFRGATLKIWRAAIVIPEAAEAAPSAREATPDEAVPYPPGCIVSSPTGEVWVAAADGVVRLLEAQAEGRPRLPAADWLRGARLQPGQLLSEN